MTPLCELAQKYGTDKYPWYTPFYHLLLGPRRLDVYRVLEIGIGTPQAMKHVPDYRPGASLRMWRDYFPSSLVVGADMDARALFTEDRIETVQADQNNPEALGAALRGYGMFDLIVDDGSHDPVHQITTFRALFPRLWEGGLYIIEDADGNLGPDLPYQLVSCWVPWSPHAGRLIVVSK